MNLPTGTLGLLHLTTKTIVVLFHFKAENGYQILFITMASLQLMILLLDGQGSLNQV